MQWKYANLNVTRGVGEEEDEGFAKNLQLAALHLGSGAFLLLLSELGII